MNDVDGAEADDRDVRVEITVEVGGDGPVGRRRPHGGPVDGGVRDRHEQAGTVVEEDRDVRRVLVEHREVGILVAVEVGGADKTGRPADRVDERLGQNPCPVAEEDRDPAQALSVRDGEVEVVVAVEVMNQDPVGLPAHVDRGGRPEGPGAGPPEDRRETVVVAAREGEIGEAVLVEVAGVDRVRKGVEADFEGHRRREIEGCLGQRAGRRGPRGNGSHSEAVPPPPVTSHFDPPFSQRRGAEKYRSVGVGPARGHGCPKTCMMGASSPLGGPMEGRRWLSASSRRRRTSSWSVAGPAGVPPRCGQRSWACPPCWSRPAVSGRTWRGFIQGRWRTPHG